MIETEDRNSRRPQFTFAYRFVQPQQPFSRSRNRFAAVVVKIACSGQLAPAHDVNLNNFVFVSCMSFLQERVLDGRMFCACVLTLSIAGS